MNIDIYIGNCLETLQKMDDQSVNTCITSPPYWGLRDYNGEEEQLGLEDTPELFVENLVKVFREVKRVLKDDGTVWLNLGDTYLKNKQLGSIPWRVALALQADGWYLRQDIIWHKPNPMPESVRDRCTKAHEYIFLLSKNVKYYFDSESIKEDSVNAGKTISLGEKSFAKRQSDGMNRTPSGNALASEYKVATKRNKRSVWTVTTKPFKGAHFATFPMDLIEPCVLAGCPEKICVNCQTPYVRQMKKTGQFQRRWSLTIATAEGSPHEGQSSMQNTYEDLGLQKQCDCNTDQTTPGTVLDPFGGSGTTAIVANKHKRNAVLCELNEKYVDIAKERIANTLGMMSKIREIR